MLRWAVGFVTLALVSAAFGFGEIVSGVSAIAKVLFFAFLVMAAVTLLVRKTEADASDREHVDS